jgi:hypothetical protein
MTDYVVQPASRGNGAARQGSQTGECQHPPGHGNIRNRKFRDGTTHLTRQCPRCGAQIGAWLKQDPYTPNDIPPFDETLQGRWRDRHQLSLL